MDHGPWMDLSCPVCYEVDKDGEWLQCDRGHPVCADCYWDDYEHPRHNGKRPTCVLCRDVLKRGDAVRCLERMQAIAAKKAAVAAKEAAVKCEVELVMQEDENFELAMAASLVDAKEREEAAKAEAQAIGLIVEEEERDRAKKRDQEQAGLEAAQKLANETGGLDEHVKAETEREATVKRTKYTNKLHKHIAGTPDRNRVSVCCTIIEGIFEQLSPEERVLVHAGMAKAAAAASSSLLSPDDVATMNVPELRKALKARGRDQSGLKSELAARLLATLVCACDDAR